MKVCEQCKSPVEEFFSFCLSCGADTEKAGELAAGESVDAYAATHARMEAADSGAVEQAEGASAEATPDPSGDSELTQESVVVEAEAPSSPDMELDIGDEAETEPVPESEPDLIEAPTESDSQAGRELITETEVAAFEEPLKLDAATENDLSSDLLQTTDDAPFTQLVPRIQTPLPVAMAVDSTVPILLPHDENTHVISRDSDIRNLATEASMDGHGLPGDFEIDHGLEAILTPTGDEIPCMRCEQLMLVEHLFCGHCGHRLSDVEKKAVSQDLQTDMVAQGPVVAHIVSINKDGSEGLTFDLHQGQNSIGRDGTSLVFESDSYLDGHHANIVIGDDNELLLSDMQTLNGTFVRITEPVMLSHGDFFRVGQELLRYESMAQSTMSSTEPGCTRMSSVESDGDQAFGRVVQVLAPGHAGNAFLLTQRFVTLGREVGDIVISDDGYISSRHATLTRRENALFIEDLNSSNGTYVRIKDSISVTEGDLLLMGQQLFRIAI